MAMIIVGSIVTKNGKLILYTIEPSCCSKTPSTINAVNNVIGMKESHFTTVSDSLIFVININGIIRVNQVTTPHKTMINSICKVVVIYRSPPLTPQ